MVKVKVIAPFYDKAADVSRAVGEEFEVSAKRLAELNACGREQCFAPLVEEVAKPSRAKAAK